MPFCSRTRTEKSSSIFRGADGDFFIRLPTNGIAYDIYQKRLVQGDKRSKYKILCPFFEKYIGDLVLVLKSDGQAARELVARFAERMGAGVVSNGLDKVLLFQRAMDREIFQYDLQIFSSNVLKEPEGVPVLWPTDLAFSELRRCAEKEEDSDPYLFRARYGRETVWYVFDDDGVVRLPTEERVVRYMMVVDAWYTKNFTIFIPGRASIEGMRSRKNTEQGSYFSRTDGGRLPPGEERRVLQEWSSRVSRLRVLHEELGKDDSLEKLVRYARLLRTTGYSIDPPRPEIRKALTALRDKREIDRRLYVKIRSGKKVVPVAEFDALVENIQRLGDAFGLKPLDRGEVEATRRALLRKEIQGTIRGLVGAIEQRSERAKGEATRRALLRKEIQGTIRSLVGTIEQRSEREKVGRTIRDTIPQETQSDLAASLRRIVAAQYSSSVACWIGSLQWAGAGPAAASLLDWTVLQRALALISRLTPVLLARYGALLVLRGSRAYAAATGDTSLPEDFDFVLCYTRQDPSPWRLAGAVARLLAEEDPAFSLLPPVRRLEDESVYKISVPIPDDSPYRKTRGRFLPLFEIAVRSGFIVHEPVLHGSTTASLFLADPVYLFTEWCRAVESRNPIDPKNAYFFNKMMPRIPVLMRRLGKQTARRVIRETIVQKTSYRKHFLDMLQET
jgi:hypothetical protein